MMNMKKTYIILGTTILSISAFTGCNSTDNSSLVSAFSDSIMEIEIPEPADSLNEGVSLNRGNTDTEIEGANGSQGSIEETDQSEFVDGTALTQEEIDELKKNATDNQKIGFEAYEALSKGESYTDSYGYDIKEVVGKPGDTSWRQMTDEEAQAALEKNPNDIIADGELKAGTWNKFYDGKIYFNPYEYYDAMRARVESAPDVIHDFE